MSTIAHMEEDTRQEAEASAYERFKALDDAQVIAMAQSGDPAARIDLERRKRMEVCWSGTWSSGPSYAPASAQPGPIPAHWNRPRQSKTLSGKLQDRAEVRKLYAQARTGNKAESAAAKHLLKTRYGQSVF